MMDKEFEMQTETPGPVVVQRPNIPNDYSREKLSDLLDGEWLEEAKDMYTLLSVTGAEEKKCFLASIYNAQVIENAKEPKPRAFTAAELKAAIQFFTGAQIPIGHIEMWGRGIDPYLVEGENPADQDEF